MKYVFLFALAALALFNLHSNASALSKSDLDSYIDHINLEENKIQVGFAFSFPSENGTIERILFTNPMHPDADPDNDLMFDITTMPDSTIQRTRRDVPRLPQGATSVRPYKLPYKASIDGFWKYLQD